MGIRLWLFFQSIHQIQECYGVKAKTILDNIATQQYFGTHSYEAAEELSKRIGDATIAITTSGKTDSETNQQGERGKGGGSVTTGSSTNYSDIGRRLYKAEEILLLPKHVGLVFHRNIPVILSFLIPFNQYQEYRAGGIVGVPNLGRSATRASLALLLAGLIFVALAIGWPLDLLPHQQARFPPFAEQSEANSRRGFYRKPLTNTRNLP
jgi:type IV secretion system protein VirD4